MVKSGQVDLLLHPLTQKYLEMKWHAYGMYVHLFNMFIFLLFLGMVTTFSAGVLGKYEIIAEDQDLNFLEGNATNNNTTPQEPTILMRVRRN